MLHTIAHLYALWEGRGVLSKSPSCEKKGIVKPGMEGTDLGGNLKETQSIERGKALTEVSALPR